MIGLPLVYVAGPITIPDPLENTHYAIKAATALLDSGLVAPYVPHLTCFWHVVTPRPYETWLAYDLEILARCDALLRLPGESAGADREVAFAVEQGIPVLWSVDEVEAWAANR